MRPRVRTDPTYQRECHYCRVPSTGQNRSRTPKKGRRP
jgi:hypothetical protein